MPAPRQSAFGVGQVLGDFLSRARFELRLAVGLAAEGH